MSRRKKDQEVIECERKHNTQSTRNTRVCTHLLDVHVGQVRDEVVANKKSHQHPVINDLLKVISKG